MVKEDGKIYRVDGYGHRAEAGYLQMKEDGKTVKEVDGYGNRAEAGYLQIKGDKIYIPTGRLPYGAEARGERTMSDR